MYIQFIIVITLAKLFSIILTLDNVTRYMYCRINFHDPKHKKNKENNLVDISSKNNFLWNVELHKNVYELASYMDVVKGSNISILYSFHHDLMFKLFKNNVTAEVKVVHLYA